MEKSNYICSKSFKKIKYEYNIIEINISKIRPYIHTKSKEYFDSIKNNNIDNFLDLTFKN